MNIQALQSQSCGVRLDDISDVELFQLCQMVLELLNDCERLWVAMPQCPQNYGDCPGDPDFVFGEPSSSSG